MFSHQPSLGYKPLSHKPQGSALIFYRIQKEDHFLCSILNSSERRTGNMSLTLVMLRSLRPLQTQSSHVHKHSHNPLSCLEELRQTSTKTTSAEQDTVVLTSKPSKHDSTSLHNFLRFLLLQTTIRTQFRTPHTQQLMNRSPSLEDRTTPTTYSCESASPSSRIEHDHRDRYPAIRTTKISLADEAHSVESPAKIQTVFSKLDKPQTSRFQSRTSNAQICFTQISHSSIFLSVKLMRMEWRLWWRAPSIRHQVTFNHGPVTMRFPDKNLHPQCDDKDRNLDLCGDLAMRLPCSLRLWLIKGKQKWFCGLH
ncbi:hypothetical protein Drorol1_Dr00011817 [Drosera rotundifolia]